MPVEKYFSCDILNEAALIPPLIIECLLINIIDIRSYTYCNINGVALVD